MSTLTIKLSFLVPLLVLLGCAVPLFAEYLPELYDVLVYVNTQPSITDIETKIIEYEEKYAGRLYEYTEVRLHTLRILRESIGSRERLESLNMLDERWAALAAERDLTSDEYRVWADVLNMRIPLVPMKKLIQVRPANRRGRTEQSLQIPQKSGCPEQQRSGPLLRPDLALPSAYEKRR